MSWLFSRALVEAFSEDISLDGEQSVQSSGNSTQQAYCAPDKMTGFSRLSQYGMTYKRLTEDRGEALCKLYREAFPVRTSALPERELVSQENDQVCGNTWHALLARYDQSTHSWKTAQCSLFEDLELSLETFPRWGMTVGGELYLQQTLVQTTNETEYGLWPTVTATANQLAPSMIKRQKNPITWATPTTMDTLPPKSEKALLREATVVRPGRSKPANLRDQVSNMKIWPTPTTMDTITRSQESYLRVQNRPKQGKNLTKLADIIHWPTPQASDHRDRGNMSNPSVQRRVEIGKQISLSQSVDPSSGQLNPMWVEWLMGWPLGWTDLKPLEMDKSPSALQPHGNYLHKETTDSLLD